MVPFVKSGHGERRNADDAVAVTYSVVAVPADRARRRVDEIGVGHAQPPDRHGRGRAGATPYPPNAGIVTARGSIR